MRAKYIYEILSEIGANTKWTGNYKGKEITISLQDINNYLDKNNIGVQEIDPSSIKSLLIDTKRDPKRVQSANLSFPIILTKKDNKFTHILDGQHRVVKCLESNIKKIKARILDLDTAPDQYKFLFK